MDLSRHRLGEALDGELGSVVVGGAGEGAEAGGRGNIHDEATAAVGSALAHALDGPHRDPGRAVEHRLHVALYLLLGRVLRVARERVSRIVDDDVEAQLLLRPVPPLRGRLLEGLAHRRRGGHVQLELQDVGVRVVQVGQGGGVACCGDEAVGGVLGDDFAQLPSETLGASGDYIV